MKKQTIAMMIIAGLLVILMAIPCASAAEDDVDVKIIDLKVGDTFTYTPFAVEGAYIEAYGEGVIESVAARDGAFLVWNSEGNILSGTPVCKGTYNVTLMATWIEGGKVMQAYQVILFIVAENDGTPGYINYGSAESPLDDWTQTVEITPVSSSNNSNGRSLTLVDVLCIGMVGVCATIYVIRRNPISLLFTVAFTALTVCDLFGVIL